MELRLAVFILTLPLLSTIVQSVRFQIESGVAKCIHDELKINSMTVAEYSVVNPNEGHPLPEHHKISVALFTPKEKRLHHGELIESGQFTYQVEENGKHLLCFLTDAHEPILNTTVELNWRSGIAAKGWSNVAKKETVDTMELELKKMEDTISVIMEEMFDFRDREEDMQELMRHTNSIMGYLGLVSLFICLSVAGIQVWHLKSFFEKKKII
ncbi:hypothetical protein Lser_V15G11585 [Lactuca serriola]